MAYLRNNQRATNFTRDFLRIIEKHMLVIEKDKRAEAPYLKSKFDDLKRKCTNDPSYYTPRVDYPSEKSFGQQVLEVPDISRLQVG